MIRLSRFHWALTLTALVLLRVVVGFHFFKEGTDKIKNGFTAEYFLKAAKGPMAPMFRKMLDDPNGEWRFCLTEDPETGKKKIDPTLTFALWDDFLDRVYGHYQFGDEKLEKKLADRYRELSAAIKTARNEPGGLTNVSKLELQLAKTEQDIASLRNQLKSGEEILASHIDEMQFWLDSNQIELLAFFETAHRVNGFERDGASKEEVAIEVASLRDQVTSIKSDREKQLNTWASEVEAIWDSYESAIVGLALPSDSIKLRPDLKLHRPFKQTHSKLQWINRIIPWFDTIVGALLMLGLFTRLASLAGALFLASVIATQPPWVPDTLPTYFYAIELVALLVIFATLAGRIGGLDFFFSGFRKTQPAAAETSNI